MVIKFILEYQLNPFALFYGFLGMCAFIVGIYLFSFGFEIWKGTRPFKGLHQKEEFPYSKPMSHREYQKQNSSD
jgi:hypothetical protein